MDVIQLQEGAGQWKISESSGCTGWGVHFCCVVLTWLWAAALWAALLFPLSSLSSHLLLLFFSPEALYFPLPPPPAASQFCSHVFETCWSPFSVSSRIKRLLWCRSSIKLWHPQSWYCQMLLWIFDPSSDSFFGFKDEPWGFCGLWVLTCSPITQILLTLMRSDSAAPYGSLFKHIFYNYTHMPLWIIQNNNPHKTNQREGFITGIPYS